MSSAVSAKKRALIGMGKTGLSCARFLRARGEDFVWLDTRAAPPQLAQLRAEFPQTDMLCGDLPSAVLCTVTELVVSPGVSLQEPAIADALRAGVAAVGDIELFVRATDKPVVAITGSNAKSTVTTLVGEMAQACGLHAGVGGNLGTPVLDMLAGDAATDCYVLELSSFQLETTHSLRAQAATILNISDDHLDRYTGMAEYVAAKQRVYRGARHVVTNRADPLTQPVQHDSRARQWSFGLDNAGVDTVGVAVREDGEWLVQDGEQALMAVADIRLAGRHNLANVAASFALAAAMGWDMARCADAVCGFNGLAHRCQWVAEKNGVRYYNDSKGTNIGATIAAIEGLAAQGRRNIVLIAGGEGKGADFAQLAPFVGRHVKALVLIGRDAELIAQACTGAEQYHAADMRAAVARAAALAASGDVVLLSPACASFDMFSGYDDRGRQYRAAVEALS